MAPRMFEREDDEGGGKGTYWNNNYTNTADVSLSASSTPNSLCSSLWQPLALEAPLNTGTSTRHKHTVRGHKTVLYSGDLRCG